jgi:hypothetical protein
MREYPLPPKDDERRFGQFENTDKALTIGILGAVAALLLIDSIFFNQSSEEAHTNQPSTQSLADGDNSTTRAQ